MTCINPVVIPSKAKNARPGQTQYVPCGKCVGCMQDHQNSWIYRLSAQQRTSKHSLFLTLTYDETNVPLMVYPERSIERYSDYVKRKSIKKCEFTLNPKDMSDYWKRVRKALVNSNLKYFQCAEYGDQFKRPHYHAAVFYDIPDDPVLVERTLQDKWHLGFITIEPLIPNRIKYVTKYMLKTSAESAPSPDVIQCYQRSSHGLGVQGFFKDEDYYFTHGCDYLFTHVIINDGVKVPIPRYYRRKFYSGTEFETDIIQQQDENRRKKEIDEFKRFCQDYTLKKGKCTFTEVESAYLRHRDYEARRRHQNLVKKSRI